VGKAGAASSEAINNIVLSDNTTSSVESLVSTVAGSSAEWRINSIDRGPVLAGEFLRFVGRGSRYRARTANSFLFVVAPSRINGVINFVVIDNETGGLNFATHHTAGNEVPTAFYGYLDVYNLAAITALQADGVANRGTYAETLAGATATTNVRSRRGWHGDPLEWPTPPRYQRNRRHGASFDRDQRSGRSHRRRQQHRRNDACPGRGGKPDLRRGRRCLTVSSIVAGVPGVNEMQRFTLAGTAPVDGTTTHHPDGAGRDRQWCGHEPDHCSDPLQQRGGHPGGQGSSCPGPIAAALASEGSKWSAVSATAFDITFLGALGAINQTNITGVATGGTTVTPDELARGPDWRVGQRRARNAGAGRDLREHLCRSHSGHRGHLVGHQERSVRRGHRRGHRLPGGNRWNCPAA